MKRLILLLLILPFLTACPEDTDDERKSSVEAFRKNGYDFAAFKKQEYKNIKFRMPESFEFDFGTSYCYKSSALTRRDLALGIIFTVERFTEDDLESELMEDYMIEDDLLNGFNDAYTDRRLETLYDGGISFKKDTPKNVKYKGVIQTLVGKYSEYADNLYYATATLKIKDEYYIFQFISKKEMMDYVYDDFERILASVRRKK